MDKFCSGTDCSGLARVLRVGTVCSGTDCPVLAIEALLTAARTVLGEKFGAVNCVAKHSFSSEIVASKRAFIHKVVEPHLSFGDVGDLIEGQAVAYGGRLLPDAVKDRPCS